MNPYLSYRAKQVLRTVARVSRRHRRSMSDVAAHLRTRGFHPQTIIDVGVFRGTYELYLVWPAARLALVEPMLECERALKYICEHRQVPASYVLAAAGAEDGHAMIHFSDDVAGASIVGGGGGRQIPVYTLDSLAAKMEWRPPYLLKIDVQGGEAAVIRGASQTLKNCEVVMLETQLFDSCNSGYTIVEMIDLMKTHGFVPFDIYDGLCRPLDDALGQIDIAFVKKEGRFRESNAWENEAQGRKRRRISRLRKIIEV